MPARNGLLTISSMPKPRKRKHSETESSASLTDSKFINQPFPTYPRPTPDECLSVRSDLLSLHGFPVEFFKYRNLRPDLPRIVSQPSHDIDPRSPLPGEPVLDGLVNTVLSQNTTETNSYKAFASLKSAFPSWEDVVGADSKSIESAIRRGGLAATKAACIKNLLKCLLEKRGKLCLEYLHDLSIDQVKAELSQFKGIGPKTVACVLMFHLQLDDFPVDTHIFQIAKSIGWVPENADTKRTYLHLNQRIPNEMKFDLNCLLYTHGKLCRRCSDKGTKQKNADANFCPLLKYGKNTELCRAQGLSGSVNSCDPTVSTTKVQTKSSRQNGMNADFVSGSCLPCRIGRSSECTQEKEVEEDKTSGKKNWVK